MRKIWGIKRLRAKGRGGGRYGKSKGIWATYGLEVRISDLVYVKRPHENQGARNRIDRKHVDFAICETKTMDPKLVVELDDKSHQRKDRQDRDAFVDEVFRIAGIPIVHIPAAKGYQVDEIRAVLHNAWTGGGA